MAENTNRPANSITGMIIAGMIGGIISAGAIIGYQAYAKMSLPDQQSRIIVVDMNAIMNHKRSTLIEKYKGAYTEANAKTAEADAKAFVEKLQDGIVRLQKNHIILASDAVIGPSVDMTNELIAYAEGKNNDDNNNAKNKIGKLLKDEKE